ncbi:GntR family transcriptional regulator [Amycolatopsis albispora]|uniref:GntR family transcriptional regulator n=1 Tax=Amycolatopsis albispora TaxID=1804986 RepID=A0A344KZH4_9PSEU|nr:GntR family transcriptional regulator [Amycolatopsis albispora]AXB41198.1 GntR family transcriptional regulator [Amycolatopsis albispora]
MPWVNPFGEVLVEQNLQVSRQSDVPIYRQLVSQLSFMIESGELAPGRTLPSARLLADNLHINRNTVARAYADLGERGLVETRGRGGTVVTGAGHVPERERARAILAEATRACVELGVPAAEIQAMVASLAARAEEDRLKVSFVECNADRAKYFAGELAGHLGLPVKPLVLGEFDPVRERADLVLTTFFHLAEVRARWRGAEVVAIVAAPHVRTLVEIAAVPPDRTVGIWYSTEDQATAIRDSLTQSGLANIKVLHGLADDDLDGVDLVVIPSELPELKARLEGRVGVIEFGNVLDAASIRMVTEVVADLRAAKRARADADPLH